MRHEMRMRVKLWEHTCCQSRHWSGSSRCDRCGATATNSGWSLSITEAVAQYRSRVSGALQQRPTEVSTCRCCDGQGLLGSEDMGTWSVCPICDGFGSEPLSDASELKTSAVTAIGDAAGCQPRTLQQGSSTARRRPVPELDDTPHPTLERSNSDVERAFVFGLWMLTGVGSTFMAIGTFAEFEQGHFALAFLLATGAAGPLTGLVALAVDGWQRGRGGSISDVSRSVYRPS